MAKYLIVAAFALVLSGWYLSYLASRLDGLHHRIETSWAHLDALLQKRAGIALEIANSSKVDAGSSLALMAAVYEAREANIVERSDAEIALAQSLKLLQDDEALTPSGIDPDLLSSLTKITEKIALGITIHTEAVRSAQNLRGKFFVRFFRLAGHAPLPMRYSFEDDIL